MPLNEVTIYDYTTSPGAGVTVKPARRLKPKLVIDRMRRDVNGALYEADLNYSSVEELELELYLSSITHSELNQLWEWYENRTKLTVTDGAVTSPQDLTKDAYYKTYTCYIDDIPGDLMSPYKMGEGPFTIKFVVDAVTTVTV